MKTIIYLMILMQLITSNPAARQAYHAVGFRKVGHYSLVYFTTPVSFALPKPALLSPRRTRRQAELANSRGAA